MECYHLIYTSQEREMGRHKQSLPLAMTFQVLEMEQIRSTRKNWNQQEMGSLKILLHKAPIRLSPVYNFTFPLY